MLMNQLRCWECKPKRKDENWDRKDKTTRKGWGCLGENGQKIMLWSEIGAQQKRTRNKGEGEEASEWSKRDRKQEIWGREAGGKGKERETGLGEKRASNMGVVSEWRDRKQSCCCRLVMRREKRVRVCQRERRNPSCECGVMQVCWRGKGQGESKADEVKHKDWSEG